MSTLTELIRPINSDHSIKEAVITVFLKEPLGNPAGFGLIDNLKGRFQKFEEQHRVKYELQSTTSGFESSAPQIDKNTGFRFQQYDESGNMLRALQGVNEPVRSYISYHAIKYPGWADFLNEFLALLSEIIRFQPDHTAMAYSLLYVDEFICNFEIEVQSVFSINSPLLPSDFFINPTSHYVLASTKTEEIDHFDRLEISMAPNLANELVITLNHNVGQEIIKDFGELFVDDFLGKTLSNAHRYNKRTLRKVLTPEMCTMIKLGVE